MKTKLSVKALSLSALLALSLNAGLAQADIGSCLFGSSPQASSSCATNNTDAGNPMLMRSMEARMNQQMDWIEQGLRNGQISPAQAARMMREQWEAIQIQRGFADGGRSGGRCADSAAPGRNGGESCGLLQGIDTRQIKQIAAKLVPVMGNMAAEGMQTATTVMRALGREVIKRTQDDVPMDDRF